MNECLHQHYASNMHPNQHGGRGGSLPLRVVQCTHWVHDRIVGGSVVQCGTIGSLAAQWCSAAHAMLPCLLVCITIMVHGMHAPAMFPVGCPLPASKWHCHGPFGKSGLPQQACTAIPSKHAKQGSEPSDSCSWVQPLNGRVKHRSVLKQAL